jgi:bifunctional DNA-binding transcriptional regulator/antitoxin component of YhaV-PrlF toxin-antitoxin module
MGETTMSLVRVQKNFNLTIPGPLRTQAGIRVGDTFEVRVVRGKITFIRTATAKPAFSARKKARVAAD